MATRGGKKLRTSGGKGRRRVERRDLWQRYRTTGDPAARDELLHISLRFVHQAARSVLRQRKRSLSFEELLSAGTIGLVEALERFDPDKGASFHYFAAQRIRGAMLDALRKEQNLTRALARKRDRVRGERARIAQLRGRPPHETEIAKAMGVPLSTYWDLQQALNRDATVWVQLDGGEPSSPVQSLSAPECEDPVLRVIDKERASRVRSAVQSLPDRDRLILHLSFFEGLLLHEIGWQLGITEGRVCQLRQRAMSRLRVRLADEFDEAGTGAAREAA